MGEASKIAQNVDSDNYLLCGVTDAVQIEGYELVNSPLEYTREVVGGKTLIFNNTNGTKEIKKSLGSAEIFIASFLNVSAIVEILKQKKQIVLVCSGWKGRLAVEDTLLAGNIIHLLYEGKLVEGSTDGARVAFGEFDTKTSSWVKTPADIRKLGGALFCDRRYGDVFVYHNGAESYYGARGFRGSLRF